MKYYSNYDKGLFFLESETIIKFLREEGIDLEYDDLADDSNLSIDNFYTLHKEGVYKGAISEVSIYKTKITEKAYKILSNITYLTDLSLSTNNIRKIPTDLANLKNLQNLYLDNNKISELPLEFIQALNNGCGLDLENNNIILSKNEFEFFETQYGISLQGNSPENTEYKSLLYKNESTTLDFKSEEYKFIKESERVKSEVLKDILAFANTFKKSHILMGIKESKRGKAVVLGVNSMLDDAQLQQFVNEKTQKPIDFAFKNIQLEGKTVSLIEIHNIDGPIYSKKDYGKVKANTMYCRMGSSTKELKPDEIYKLGQMSKN